MHLVSPPHCRSLTHSLTGSRKLKTFLLSPQIGISPCNTNIQSFNCQNIFDTPQSVLRCYLSCGGALPNFGGVLPYKVFCFLRCVGVLQLMVLLPFIFKNIQKKLNSIPKFLKKEIKKVLFS